MAKKLSLSLIMLLITFVVEAKYNSTKEKVDVISVYSSSYNASEPRSESISADITGHTLTINFNEDVGIAHIVIKNAANGIYIESDNVYSTPECATFIINDAGYYRMDITLSNGEQCYGYFQVEN